MWIGFINSSGSIFVGHSNEYSVVSEKGEELFKSWGIISLLRTLLHGVTVMPQIITPTPLHH